MSNNKTEKEEAAVQYCKTTSNPFCDARSFTDGAKWMGELYQSRLATLQAENEKLWKLLEVEFWNNHYNIGKHFTMDDSWDAFQKANDLTQNKK